jgi:hypothetical protein
LKDGEFINVYQDATAVTREWPIIQIEMIAYLNTLEFFAIVFAVGVTDDTRLLRETLPAFCQGVEMAIIALYHLRVAHLVRYDSTIKLYEIWNRRLVAALLTQ